jgi:hypothetical protein
LNFQTVSSCIEENNIQHPQFQPYLPDKNRKKNKITKINKMKNAKLLNLFEHISLVCLKQNHKRELGITHSTWLEEAKIKKIHFVTLLGKHTIFRYSFASILLERVIKYKFHMQKLSKALKTIHLIKNLSYKKLMLLNLEVFPYKNHKAWIFPSKRK